MAHIEKQTFGNVTKFVIVDEGGHRIQLTIAKDEDNGRRSAYICGLFIDEKHRTEGIGSKMIDAAIQIAKQEGYDALTIIDTTAMDQS